MKRIIYRARQPRKAARDLKAYLVYNGKDYGCSHCGTSYITDTGINYCCTCGAAFISTASYRFHGCSKKPYENPCIKIFKVENVDNEY